MIFDRLAIGTANWGKEYNGAKVSEDDQKRILDYCQCSGIDMIDTATAYEWDWTKVSSYFKVVVKVKHSDELMDLPDAWCYMAHDEMAVEGVIDVFGRKCCCWGISAYYKDDVLTYLPSIYQIPYSLYDRRFELVLPQIKQRYSNWPEIHVRSVFLRGKIIKDGIEPWQCIAFCLMNPYIDRVIIGADSYEQFKENLRPFHRMDVMKKEDENLLDTRRWKNGSD